MANETLGASFSIDVTSLKSGLAQANRLIRESESEFKAAAARMDDWTESQEGLEARIKHLNNAQDLQKKKIEALNEQYAKAGYAADDMSAAAVKLRTDINKEKEALAKTEKEIAKQTKALEELGDATDDTADATDEASEGFTVMKGAAAELVASGITRLVDGCKQAISTLLALGEETLEYRENLIKLQTSFQTANLSAADAEKTFTELYGIMGDEGAATEAAQQLAKISKGEKDLEANTRILTGVMAEYGASIPLEGLAEGIAASSAMSSVQGVLADALEWQGINLDTFNEKLESLSTEEERAAYIQKTLTDLYGESADAYRENNKSVIAARKSTAAYNKQLAELGEAIEPVNAEITELKTEFAKEFVPVVKTQVTPAIKNFTKGLKDTGALKKAGQVIGFVAENFETLAATTLTAVTVYKTFSAALKVTTAINATKTAIAGLSTGVSFATKMQTGWNAAMSANPIGAVLTAVGLLTAGVAALAMSQKNATAQQDLLTESQREAVTTAQESATAYNETKTAAEALAAAELANIDYTQTLWGELKNITDENGKVKKGYEARADFIIHQLNDAFDTEYEMNDDVIQQYAEMKKSIEDVIATKRAEIMLQAYEETYNLAIQNRAATELARSIQAQELVKQEERVKNAQVKAEEARAAYLTALDEGVTGRKLDLLKGQMNGFAGAVDIEKNKLADLQLAYNQSEATLNDYYADIANYEQAHTLIIQGETEKAIGVLGELGDSFKTVASTAQLGAEEQKRVLEQQVIDTEVNARLMKEAYDKGVKGVTEQMVKTAEEQADKAKEEFLSVGGNITKGIAEGAEEEEWTLTGTMSSLIDKAFKAAKKASGINSPARKFKKPVGGMIGLGVAEGIAASTKDVVSSVDDQIKSIQAAYDAESISADVSAGVKSSAAHTANNAPTSAGVTVYQTNNFKQAVTSRLEQYKAKQELYAAARLMKAGAI